MCCAATSLGLIAIGTPAAPSAVNCLRKARRPGGFLSMLTSLHSDTRDPTNLGSDDYYNYYYVRAPLPADSDVRGRKYQCPMQQTLLRYPGSGDRIQMTRSTGRLSRRKFMASKNDGCLRTTPL